MNNIKIIYQIAQNLVNKQAPSTKADTSHWRVLDACEGSLCIINDAEGYREDQTIFNVEYTSLNHSGLGFTYIEERVDEEEITSDITFSAEVDKDYKAGDTIDYALVFTLPKEALSVYGFTFFCSVGCGYEGCTEEDNFTHPCGTDVSTLYCGCDEEITEVEEAAEQSPVLMTQQAQTVLHLLDANKGQYEYTLCGSTLEDICFEGLDIQFDDYSLYTNFAISFEDHHGLEEFYWGKAVITKEAVGKMRGGIVGFVTNSRLITALRNNNLVGLLNHLEQPQHFWSEDEDFDPLAYEWMELFEEKFRDNPSVFYQYDGGINIYTDNYSIRYSVCNTDEDNNIVPTHVYKHDGISGRHQYDAKSITVISEKDFLQVLDTL